ncbi:MAG: hypothetical protein U1A78_32040 [Polyangia bacterium]
MAARRLPAPRRLVLYYFMSPYLSDKEAKRFRFEMSELCVRNQLELVELVIDRGPPKRRVEDYPALRRVAQGEADGVLVVRSPLYGRGPVPDLLESFCAEGPSEYLSKERLARGGMLPPPLPPRESPRRVPARRRALALLRTGLTLRAVAESLTAERYRRRDREPWTVERVAELLGVAVFPERSTEKAPGAKTSAP